MREVELGDRVGHSASQWQKQNLNSGSLPPEHVLLTLNSTVSFLKRKC